MCCRAVESSGCGKSPERSRVRRCLVHQRSYGNRRCTQAPLFPSGLWTLTMHVYARRKSAYTLNRIVKGRQESTMKRNLVLAAALAAVSSHAALGASEGGDTWSEVQQQPASQSPVFATLAPLSVLQHENPSVYGTPAEGDFTDRTVRLGS